MEIVELKKKKDKQYVPPKTHEDLPQLSFVMCITGPRGAGKSLFIRNLLLRDDMLKKTFKKPNYNIIVCPSLSNGDYDEVAGKNVYKYENYDQAMIDHLMESQKQIIKKHGRHKTPEILIILDDVLDSGALQWGSHVERIFSRGRHVNINCILVSQHLNRISKTMRINSDYFVCFQPHNFNELENALEQFIPKKYQYGFEVHLREMWAKNYYQFLLIDFKTKDSTRRFREGFSTPIALDDLPQKTSRRT